MGSFRDITFRGQAYILVGGAITTPEDFENGKVSFAHLMGDGNIMRFGKQIGTEADIKYLKTRTAVESKVTVSDLLKADWTRPKVI